MTCLGYYYCPLLPFITSIILFITFYLQYFLSLNINFKSSNKTWTDSKTRTLYLIISFAAILISFIFYFMTVTVTEVKDADSTTTEVSLLKTAANTESVNNDTRIQRYSMARSAEHAAAI